MASDSDKFVLEDALATGDNDVFFNQKKWNYIVDATSNAGVFTNQIQFNLNTLASQGQWVNLSEAYIQFPIRVRIFNATGPDVAFSTHCISLWIRTDYQIYFLSHFESS